MNLGELLSNPAIQGAAAPFLVALVCAALLRDTRVAALAIVAGVCVMVWLAIGWSLEPLSSTRKLSLVVLASGLLVLIGAAVPAAWRKPAQATLAVMAGLAILWVAYGVVRQMESGAWLTGAAVVVFAAVLVGSALLADQDTVRVNVSSMWLGLGAGAVGLLGASAVLALFGIAVGAAAGALLLLQMLRGRAVPAAVTLALPAAVTAAGVLVMAVLTGGVRGYLLLGAIAIPWSVRLIAQVAQPVWRLAILASLCAAVPVVLMVAGGWFLKPAAVY